MSPESNGFNKKLNSKNDFTTDDYFYSYLLRNLKNSIKEKKIKQKKLSAVLGITQASLSNLLSGKHKISLEQFFLITKHANINFIDLYKKTYNDSQLKIELSLEEEKKLYENNYAFLLWCFVYGPKTKREIIETTSWSEVSVDEALNLLKEYNMIQIDNDGRIHQYAGGNTFLITSPKLKKEWEKMVVWHISNLIVPELEFYNKLKVPAEEEPRKYKFNFNLYFNLTEEQIKEIWNKYYEIYKLLGKMIQQNNLQGYTPGSFRLVQMKMLLFDYFNPSLKNISEK